MTGPKIEFQAPLKSQYDVIIIGGAMYGASVAWWLKRNSDFNGTVLVVERDPSYEFSSTGHTNSCIRQQFTAEINVKISQFGAEFIHNFKSYFDDEEVPEIVLQSYGYMYLADNLEFAASLKEAQRIQNRLGAGTRYMSCAEIAAEYPFYNLEDIVGGNHNLINEGYFDGGTIFDWWRRSARQMGVEYCQNEVIDIMVNETASAINGIKLASGEMISCGQLVNCTGPRAANTARMAGIELPVRPRKRYTFIFDAETRLDKDLPLTIDPSGVHMRSDGQYYLAGCPPDVDDDVEADDFEADHSIWENKVWPALAHRVPNFEAIKLINFWVGHYAFNTFDQNAIIGPHTRIKNFIFANGFSGHGLQQSPAMGRGVGEYLVYGQYRTLDLTPFSFERIENNQPFVEKAVI